MIVYTSMSAVMKFGAKKRIIDQATLDIRNLVQK